MRQQLRGLGAPASCRQITAGQNKESAGRMPALPENVELLCDGTGNSPRADAAELDAWRDWTGPRLSPKRVLGEGLMAAAAWQCVAACDVVADDRFVAANVSLVGSNQQAMGARFVHADSAISRLSRG
jgi:hypothetical protein